MARCVLVYILSCTFRICTQKGLSFKPSGITSLTLRIRRESQGHTGVLSGTILISCQQRAEVGFLPCVPATIKSHLSALVEMEPRMQSQGRPTRKGHSTTRPAASRGIPGRFRAAGASPADCGGVTITVPRSRSPSV